MKQLIALALLICSTLSSLQAQRTVEVRDEPLHKPVFQNGHIRLLDVWIGPGDTSLYHIHQIPSIFVFISETEVVQQILGKDPVVSRTEYGQTWYRNFSEGPFIHRVYGNDSGRIHAIDIELIGNSRPGQPGLKITKGLSLVKEEERNRTFRFQLAPGEKTTIQTRSYPGVWVVYKGAMEKWEKRRKVMARGDWSWMDAGRKLVLVNSGTEPMEAYFYEIF